ncbi:ribonuclease H [Senna tora]|uniref:Ribonuclease H n=1 Tax=Senna tora TaxID=362788 RepID=A0A834SNM5_9FABA|nr:ribonuclease H [Senna tora]
MVGRDLLKEGMRKSIGNGQSTWIWKDTMGCLRSANYPYNPKSECVRIGVEKVCELMNAEGDGWNEEEGDKWIWENDRSGIYTVKSGYKSAMLETWSQFDFSLDINAKATSRFWKRVWKLPILSRRNKKKFENEVIMVEGLLAKVERSMDEIQSPVLNDDLNRTTLTLTWEMPQQDDSHRLFTWLIGLVEYWIVYNSTVQTGLMEIEKDIISITTTCPKMLEEQEFDISVADQ